MDPIFSWLDSTAVQVWGVDVSWAEVLGDLTGLAAVWWAARERVWTWPIGNLNSALFLVLFLDAKLYANAFLQVVFIVLGFYGWWTWVRRHGPDLTLAVVRRTTRNEWLGLAAVGLPGLAAWTAWLMLRTDSPAPFWDSLTLVLSVLATYGQARKLLESWWIWITVDVVSVPLYLSRGLYPTAALYVVFGGLCVIGLRDWTRALTPAPADEPIGVLA
ncbi:MAG: nicotinamide riboside transporter PnuC [Acidimicrobiales bacterium]